MSTVRSARPRDVMSRNPPPARATTRTTSSTKLTAAPPAGQTRSSTPDILASLQSSFSQSRSSSSSMSSSSSLPSQQQQQQQQPFRVAILVISDTASRDASTDKVIPTLIQTFTDFPGKTWSIRKSKIVPDDFEAIQQVVTKWAEVEEQVDLIVTSGGTGFSQKDVTPEAVGPLIQKHASGLVYCMLASSSAITPFAAMGRPVAGVRNNTVIVTFPGSPKGAKENLQALLPLLPHACKQASGGDSRALHAGGIAKLERDAGLRSKSVTPPPAEDRAADEKSGDLRRKSITPPPAEERASHSCSHTHSHTHGHTHGHQIPIARTSPSDRPAMSNDPAAGPTRRYRESPYPMLSVEDALKEIHTHTPAPQIIRAKVDENLINHVLAEDVVAVENVPAFRASIVDGYAIIASNHVLVPSTKGIFPVVSISHAKPGQVPGLVSGEVSRITTGAPLPPGATAVVMVEDTILRSLTPDGKEEDEIEILTDATEPGENVREIGSDVRAGDVILRKGDMITAEGGELGLLASVGTMEVSVYRKPVVGVLSTGDEIIPHDRPGELRLGEVRDTNRPTLLTLVRAQGFEAVDLGIASDRPNALETTLRSALQQVDVILTTGGVSMGELDLLKPTIERHLDGKIHFGRVSMKPGKPTTFASITVKSPEGNPQEKLLFALPGNPASAAVTFHLFALPALHQFSGHAPSSRGLSKIRVVLEEDFKLDPKRNEYHRVVLSASSPQGSAEGRISARSTGGQRSSRIASFRGANGLLCLPVGEGWLRSGEMCEALVMGRLG